jgi:hypothetical protein
LTVLPEHLKESLGKPIAAFDVPSVEERLNELFPGHWEKDFTIRELGRVTLPAEHYGESLVEIPCLEVRCTVTLETGKKNKIDYSACVLSLKESLWTESTLKDLAFLHTMVREAGLGLGRLNPGEVVLTSGSHTRETLCRTDLGDIILDGRTLKLFESSQPREDFEEKRKTPRKLLPLQNSVPLHIRHAEDSADLNIFLLDISKSGMRIISDFDFLRDEMYSLKLCIDEECELDAQVTWKKDLWEGMYFVGFQFQQLLSGEFDKICRNLEGFSPDDRREHFRMERDMLLELRRGEKNEKIYSLILDLSISGMRAAYKGAPFDERSLADCTIFIGFEEDSVEVVAETVWSRSFDDNISVSAFKFVETGEETQKRLQKLIEQCILTNLHEAIDEITTPLG